MGCCCSNLTGLPPKVGRAERDDASMNREIPSVHQEPEDNESNEDPPPYDFVVKERDSIGDEEAVVGMTGDSTAPSEPARLNGFTPLDLRKHAINMGLSGSESGMTSSSSAHSDSAAAAAGSHF